MASLSPESSLVLTSMSSIDSSDTVSFACKEAAILLNSAAKLLYMTTLLHSVLCKLLNLVLRGVSAALRRILSNSLLIRPLCRKYLRWA